MTPQCDSVSFKGPIIYGPDCLRAQLFKCLIVYKLNCAGPDCAGSYNSGPDCAGPDRSCTDNTLCTDPVRVWFEPRFIAYILWKISLALQLYRGVPLWFNCDVCVFTVQASYSQHVSFFFFVNVYHPWHVPGFLQLFKERTSFLFTPQLKLCEEIWNV